MKISILVRLLAALLLLTTLIVSSGCDLGTYEQRFQESHLNAQVFDGL